MTAVFVGSVSAVVLSIAYPRLEDALGVVALEVIGRALLVSAGRRLVRGVLAVRRAVAMPRLGYADLRLVAPELFLGIALVRRQGRAAELVRSVLAVPDAVTVVALVYALLLIGALELLRCAGDGWAADLVRLVEAVVVAVAHPALREAPGRLLAGELEIHARLLACNKTITNWEFGA